MHSGSLLVAGGSGRRRRVKKLSSKPPPAMFRCLALAVYARQMTVR